ncbi:formate transporter [Moorella thermoacetica]|uniref:Formate transporter 1 n=2 Tax=Neomoorella thermoacetica TaxID=1525 RepID=A0AAC9HJR1_NEOTH|nr:formate/nitrite transporter family protein [Moorella thermoacetica]AKX95037.1 putative formate transporter 1 [Moorella thermoacetica]AKX97663.1 putative formate transporter 1 [Moorella thermoacetica]AOQ25178.1 putative formate transporter 1 [Moorella thermoacetica]OIQ53926.1 putative formate transporter 1 [Moorella thermoacetica]QDA01485.1 putative formate transporter 1 [Moorella thermoacetica]
MAFKLPKEVAMDIVQAGVKKAALPVNKTLVLGFLAGAYIALGGLLAVRVSGAVPNEVWGSLQKLIFAGVFPVGLMMVIIAGAELATGNFMTQPLALLERKIGVNGVFKNWVLAYLGNFIGSIFVAFFLAYMTGLTLEPVKTGDVVAKMPWAAFIVNLANAKTALNWWEAFWRGVGCNWLVALAVWMAFSANDIAGKIYAMWWPIMAFVAVGFEHSVANMFFIPLGIFVGNNPAYVAFTHTAQGIATQAPVLKATWETFFVNNLIPVTLGNIVGAGLFVGTVYWYVYLKAEKERSVRFSKAA